MSTSLKDKIQKILDILGRLAVEAKTKKIPIVVEGRNDKQTLVELGIKGEIIIVKASDKSQIKIFEEIEASDREEVILMLDFDRRGREYLKKLARFLEKSNVKPNVFYWNKLHSLVGRDVKDIEGLVSYIQTLKRKTGNS